MTAHMRYYDHDRKLTFSWDGESEQILVIEGDLFAPKTEWIPIQGAVFNATEASGWLMFFQHVCTSHIRMREDAGQPVVQEGRS